ncbi:MAG: TerB family tellurite resistance protein [Deltaproteobacteria bacterium]|nr:TerB family tellurite resistance protein [Deltaproteobacteria bacterium]
MSFLRKMFGGGLDQDDPRKFLIETMLAAMEADGDVTGEEMEVLQQNLDSHELFEGLSGEQTARLIDQAADAIREAGGGSKRVKAIADGLPSKGYRLTAYSLACEVCVSDKDLPEAEIRFLEALQNALGVDEEDARDLFDAARKDSGLMTLEEKTAKMHDMLPKLVEGMALMAAADERIEDSELDTMREVLSKIPDMAVLTPEELEEAIEVGFQRAHEGKPEDRLQGIAEDVPSLSDRYWTATYMMIIALADGKTDWREVSFLKNVQSVFGLSEASMDQGMATAALFPGVEIGGQAPI